MALERSLESALQVAWRRLESMKQRFYCIVNSEFSFQTSGGREMVRFGLLGAGRIGKIHGRNIARGEGSTLVAVADADEAAAKALAKTYGAAVRSVDEVIAARDID